MIKYTILFHSLFHLIHRLIVEVQRPQVWWCGHLQVLYQATCNHAILLQFYLTLILFAKFEHHPEFSDKATTLGMWMLLATALNVELGILSDTNKIIDAGLDGSRDWHTGRNLFNVEYSIISKLYHCPKHLKLHSVPSESPQIGNWCFLNPMKILQTPF